MNIRPRINRATVARRNLLHDSSLSSSLVQPYFIVEGQGVNDSIENMPGIQRQSIDVLMNTIHDDFAIGIRNVMLFPVMPAGMKDPHATACLDDTMHLYQAVRAIKEAYGDQIVVMTDLCLCTSTDHGHCGFVEHNEIQNDSSVEQLARIALLHAKSGTDYIACSDMMDGRVKHIRQALERAHQHTTGIMSYAVKYASAFYGPFRGAADSSPETGDRRTYQMDPRAGYKEALLEASLDEAEGADIIMVKPGLPYLDVLRRVADSINRPTAVYNVSGEYSMVMNSTSDGAARGAMVQEILASFQRAGADIIVSYHAREALGNGWVV